MARGRAIVDSGGTQPLRRRAEPWIGLALCAAVFLGWAAEQLIRDRVDYAQAFAPNWIPLVAAGIAAIGIVPIKGPPQWPRIERALRWCGLLLMVWVANGLPLDLLRVVGLIPLDVDWPGLATRASALGAALMLARLTLAYPTTGARTHAATWYGYIAFGLALPYPILRTHWALGGTLGLLWPGAGGEGWVPWLASIPWLVAAGLSLFLVSPPHWMPRRLLLIGGWSATVIVAMIGPAACWALVAALISGSDPGLGGIEVWVFALFYGSWLLWAIAAAVATRSYQVRTVGPRSSTPA